jgi:hypothetical protein
VSARSEHGALTHSERGTQKPGSGAGMSSGAGALGMSGGVVGKVGGGSCGGGKAMDVEAGVGTRGCWSGGRGNGAQTADGRRRRGGGDAIGRAATSGLRPGCVSPGGKTRWSEGPAAACAVALGVADTSAAAYEAGAVGMAAAAHVAALMLLADPDPNLALAQEVAEEVAEAREAANAGVAGMDALLAGASRPAERNGHAGRVGAAATALVAAVEAETSAERKGHTGRLGAAATAGAGADVAASLAGTSASGERNGHAGRVIPPAAAGAVAVAVAAGVAVAAAATPLPAARAAKRASRARATLRRCV